MVNLWDIQTLVCYMFDMAAIAPAPFISRSNDLMMCNDPLCHVTKGGYVLPFTSPK